MDRINKLISLSREKKIHLNQIYELSKNQESVIRDDQMDLLEDILNEKDQLMAKIDELDVNFMGVYENLLESEKLSNIYDLDVDKFSNLGDLKEVVGEIGGLLKSLDLQDKTNMALMNKNFEDVKINLKQVKTGQKIYKGYNYEAENSILIDSKK